MNPGCAVDTCDDQELPDFLRGKTSTFVLQSTTGGFSVEDLEREQQREVKVNKRGGEGRRA